MNLPKSTSTGQAKLHSGLFEGKVVMVNPTGKQLREWRGWEEKEDSKEPEYLGEDKDKNTRITIEFCVEDVMDSSKKFSLRFNITDKKVTSEKSGKNQYVSATGMSSWVVDTKDLPEWFTTFKNKNKEVVAECDYRKAYQGEANLYEFFRSWLKVDWFSPTTSVLLDMKKLFRGNVDEIRSLITAEGDENLTQSVVMLATVYIKDEEEKKMYQNITTQAFMPGWKMKVARVCMSTNSWDGDKVTKRFKDQITDSEHGVKEAYVWGLLEEFDEEKCFQASDKTIQMHTDDVDNMDY